MWDCRRRLESDISECSEGDGGTIGTPNRLAPLLFPLVAAFLAVSLFSGCGSVGGEAKADVQSESRGMPSNAGTGVENEGGSKKSGDESEKNGDGANRIRRATQQAVRPVIRARHPSRTATRAAGR